MGQLQTNYTGSDHPKFSGSIGIQAHATARLNTIVSDPFSFDTDLDPALYVEYRSGSRVLMTKDWKQLSAEIFILFVLDQKLQFTYP
jgi:hypothetical protein